MSISITWTLLILLAQAIFKMYSSIGLEFSWLHELFFFKAVITSEEEEGHQGRIDRKVLNR